MQALAFRMQTHKIKNNKTESLKTAYAERQESEKSQFSIERVKWCCKADLTDSRLRFTKVHSCALLSIGLDTIYTSII